MTHLVALITEGDYLGCVTAHGTARECSAWCDGATTGAGAYGGDGCYTVQEAHADDPAWAFEYSPQVLEECRAAFAKYRSDHV